MAEAAADRASSWERPLVGAGGEGTKTSSLADDRRAAAGTAQLIFAERPAVACFTPHFTGGLVGGPGAWKIMLRTTLEVEALLHYLGGNVGRAAVAENALPGPSGFGASSVAWTTSDFLVSPARAAYNPTGAKNRAFPEATQALGPLYAAVDCALGLGPGGRPPAAAATWAAAPKRYEYAFIAGLSPGAAEEVTYASALTSSPVMVIAIGGRIGVARGHTVYDVAPMQGVTFAPPANGDKSQAVTVQLRGVGGALFVESRLDGEPIGMGSNPGPYQTNASKATKAAEATEAFFGEWNKLDELTRDAVVADYGKQSATLPLSHLAAPPAAPQAEGAGDLARAVQAAAAAITGAAPGAPPNAPPDAVKERLDKLPAQELEYFRSVLGGKAAALLKNAWLRTIQECGAPGRPHLPNNFELNIEWAFNSPRQFFNWNAPEAREAWADLLEERDVRRWLPCLSTTDVSGDRHCRPADGVFAEACAMAGPSELTRAVTLEKVASAAYRMRDFCTAYGCMKSRGTASAKSMVNVLKDETLLSTTETLYQKRAQQIFMVWAPTVGEHDALYEKAIKGSWARVNSRSEGQPRAEKKPHAAKPGGGKGKKNPQPQQKHQWPAQAGKGGGKGHGNYASSKGFGKGGKGYGKGSKLSGGKRSGQDSGPAKKPKQG